METVTRTVRYALRGLRKSPGFTAVAVTTLALGIGLNATIFSLVSAVLFRPLPVEAPDRLVNVYGHTATSSSHDALSYPNYRSYREQAETLDGVIAHVNFFANLSIGGSSELVAGELVSDNYFDVLGVRPARGRTFAPDEFAAPGAGPVAVLSHMFWQSRFGGDPDVLGRTFRMNGLVYTVVGVAPEEFGGMFPATTAQMWVPMSMVDEVETIGNHRVTGGPTGDSWLDSRGRHFLWIKGRMRPGVEVAQVRAELDAIAARLAEQYPEANERERVTVLRTTDVALNPDFDATVAPAGFVLLGAVGLVLLVACANLANMMLARGAARRRDHAIQLALGAGRRRMIGQLLTESVIVALAGGIAAILLAVWLTGIIGRLQPPLPIEIGLNIDPDWRVLVFTFAAAVATGIAFGLVPAVRASRPDLVPALKDTGDGRSARGRRVELRDALVVSQVALSLALLVVGALMARSLGEAARVDMGYDAQRTAYLSLALEMNGYDAHDGGLFVHEGQRRLAALPAVEAVGLASRVPQSLNNNGFGLYIDGHPSTLADRPIVLDGARVDEHYFDAMGLSILRGRGFTAADRGMTERTGPGVGASQADADAGGAPAAGARDRPERPRRVAVITETMASRLWPDTDALNRQFRLSRQGEPYRVVGVVEDYKVDTPGEAPKPYLHLPLERAQLFANYIVRTATPATSLVPTLERELRSLDPDLVFLDTGTLRDLADVRTFPIRAGAWLIGVFGVLALLLAAVGLYGVIAFAVSRRVREIGIRKALGAERGSVVRLVVRRGMALVAIGGLVGAGLAAAGASALSSVLYVGAFDLISFAVAFSLLALVAALAHWVPASRAARVDPMVALRAE